MQEFSRENLRMCLFLHCDIHIQLRGFAKSIYNSVVLKKSYTAAWLCENPLTFPKLKGKIPENTVKSDEQK